MSNEIKTQVVVLGSGPGGYSAAFRAADLGLDVVLVEKYSNLGGVCLNVGCIPSKALLHVAKVLDDAKDMASHGVTFGQPEIDLEKIRQWKDKDVVGKLTQGIAGMAKMRKVKTVTGYGKFTSDKTIEVEGADGKTTVTFDNAIIACGSSVVNLPFIPEDDRIIDSTGALELKDVPGEMLVLGGGIIGLEMGTVYSSLGAKVSVVEFADQLVPAADADVVKIYTKYNKPRFESIMLSTKVVAVDAKEDGLYVTFEGKNAPEGQVRYDKILVAVGRKPNGHLVDADKAGVNVDERGFINVSKEMRTNVPHIFAIGDVVGQPMLAHKAVHEAHVAAEVISGKKHEFDPRCIPSIAYTDPEIAWVGVTEREAKEQGLNIEVANFPWSASGRAIASARTEGKTKLIFDKESGRVLGGAIVGINAGEMLGEIGLAVEMGADAEDVGLTIHAHPTLNESIGLAAEVFEGSITDLPNAKAVKKKK
ncbi:dihydrolipoyl dehydrogenase [Thalassotalea sp. LPB0316]|uniref:dihydrolipoyl dehydrogenase n=1 Tax=Thalassotalea sp. LPB0316 TaxID=2769490 RepID=UPI001867CAF4|nr:dihydrolipoyl dehydrogenase [Thalassotalea sp. LPB0316]QOL25879.1 dihydrolipoyl dehydrogenase [Thalassotalea sp. LPB0316]